jgi:hypothetical protein
MRVLRFGQRTPLFTYFWWMGRPVGLQKSIRLIPSEHPRNGHGGLDQPMLLYIVGQGRGRKDLVASQGRNFPTTGHVLDACQGTEPCSLPLLSCDLACYACIEASSQSLFHHPPPLAVALGFNAKTIGDDLAADANVASIEPGLPSAQPMALSAAGLFLSYGFSSP